MNLAAVLGASLMLVPTSNFAGPTQGALPPGKPAGVQQAQYVDNEAIYATIGLAVLGIVIGIAASSDNNAAANTAPAPTQH
ncbi:MAG: hypothetical protein V4601_03000 [Pseudomonadota bacterium]